MLAPAIQSFFDPATSTVTHVASDPAIGRVAVIDSVRNYDPNSGRTSHASAYRVIPYVQQQGLVVDWILETHAHADHLSAAPYGITELEFVTMRSERDKTLAMPVLILPSVQVSVPAGKFPPAENNGVSYLKISMNLL